MLVRVLEIAPNDGGDPITMLAGIALGMKYRIMVQSETKPKYNDFSGDFEVF
jgi:hypothetical protein